MHYSANRKYLICAMEELHNDAKSVVNRMRQEWITVMIMQDGTCIGLLEPVATAL